MYKLKTNTNPAEEFHLTTGAYRLGSAWDSEVVIQDESVAPYHCEVVVTAKMITVRNLSREHETFVQGESVKNATLQPGQTGGAPRLHVDPDQTPLVLLPDEIVLPGVGTVRTGDDRSIPPPAGFGR